MRHQWGFNLGLEIRMQFLTNSRQLSSHLATYHFISSCGETRTKNDLMVFNSIEHTRGKS